ncbi:AraC family transcriptional regulator [Pseudomonas sp. NA-150]|uniref:AraC family transcriptional regulator n=1 Tax=Pseudomonas sp. NA-150 TaxID=3367525 RepID=UPI0037CC757A
MRDSTEMLNDPFSDILKLTNAHSVVSGGFTASNPWAIGFAPPNKIKYFAVAKGGCWLCIERDPPLWIAAGEMFLLAAPRAFVMASDPTVDPVDANTLFTANAGTLIQLGAGDEVLVIGGHVQLDTANAGLLVDVLPPLIHVRADSPQATVLQWLVEQLLRERQAQLPGAQVASGQLAQLMFVQLLRAYLSDAGTLPAGWLRALADPRIAPALRLMHREPGRAWQLEELAQSVAMSRTTFALRFKTVAGVPPLTYLYHWRMQLAERCLREDNTPLSVLALSLGYTSESAFSTAFKRSVGLAPKRYREAARATAAADDPA